MIGTLIMVGTLAIVGRMGAQDFALRDSYLYIQDRLEWSRGYRPGQPAPELALADILILMPDGTLATVTCYLHRAADQRLNIIYSEGYGIQSGQWRKADGKLTVRYKPLYMSIAPARIPSEKREQWGYVPAQESGRLASSVTTKDKRFVPLTNLAEIDSLARVIEFRKREARRGPK